MNDLLVLTFFEGAQAHLKVRAFNHTYQNLTQVRTGLCPVVIQLTIF
ncbi:hypothetical protein [Desulfovibrio desulfuricans]